MTEVAIRALLPFVPPAERREHRYRLTFERGIEDEVILAVGPTQAVEQRVAEALPHTITDLTVMEEWAAGNRPAQGRGLLHGEGGEFDENAPLASARVYRAAKDLT